MRRMMACCLLLLAGCAVPKKTLDTASPASEKASTPLPPSARTVLPVVDREMIVFVPQTDEAAGAWIKWFTKYSNLRMVIAVSPRFQHVAKDLGIRNQIQVLMKSGRLELGLQIPNAPILP